VAFIVPIFFLSFVAPDPPLHKTRTPVLQRKFGPKNVKWYL